MSARRIWHVLVAGMRRKKLGPDQSSGTPGQDGPRRSGAAMAAVRQCDLSELRNGRPYQTRRLEQLEQRYE